MVTQTEKEPLKSTLVQTEREVTKCCYIQTINPDLNSEEVQTEKIRNVMKEVQVCAVTCEMEAQTEVDEQEAPPSSHKRLSIVLEQEECEEAQSVPKKRLAPATARADELRKKIDLTLVENDELGGGELIRTPKTSSTSSNKKLSKEYLRNRDPMKEFF